MDEETDTLTVLENRRNSFEKISDDKVNELNSRQKMRDIKKIIRSKNLIFSSSLIAHPRCLQILNIKSLPLRDAFILGEDKVVDSVLSKTKKLIF